MELSDALAGVQLEAHLEQLIALMLMSKQRNGRTILAVRLTARLNSGGSWSAHQTFGKPTASKKTIYSLLLRRLDSLPAPATSLMLEATELGPKASEQLRLPQTGTRDDENRLGEAIRQIRATQKPEAGIQRIVDVDAHSRVPERQAILTPYLDD